VNWRDLGHSLAGGSERYAWEYALALRDAGARVDFVTARDTGQAGDERVDGVRIRRRGGSYTFYLHAAWFFLTRRRHLDAVIDPECGIPTFSPLFVRRSTAVVLVVHHVHMKQFRTYFGPGMAAFGRFLESRLMPLVYRRATTVAVSESTRAEMVDQLHWKRPIGLLRNGSGEPDWGCDAEAKDPHRVVALGRLVPHKRVDLVVRAVSALRAELPDLRLDVVGRGPEEAALRALVDELGLTDTVTIHGFLDEARKKELLRAAALHVSASDIEGWGQVVIDAAAHGVPTIARDVPGLRDSIRSETGWLVPDRAPDLDAVLDSLVDRMRSVLHELESVEVRRRLLKECLAWAHRFSWTNMHREGVALVLAAMPRRTEVRP
jgi:glycosyltransferase involved in cell wall biosynthesis